MPVEVVTGAPFSGKGAFVRDEVARREADGELGLVALDWTALYGALVPGVQSSFRDDRVSDTGAPRMVGAAWAFVAGAVEARELSGYVVTQSPRQAVELADRYQARIVEVEADVGDVADRADAHMSRLRRLVPRASRARTVAGCRRQAVAYFREAPALVGRARPARRRGRRWEVDHEGKRPFDRELWERGLTDRGREALRELREQGNPEPTPADVMAWLLRDRG